MEEILENRSNFLIIKEDNFLKLFSYKSLVSVYNTESKTFEEVPYEYITINGVSSSYSSTTTRHINKFKRYIKDNF